MTLSRILTLLIVITVFFLGVSMIMVVTHHLNKMILNQQQLDAHTKLNEITISIRNYLDTYEKSLLDISKFPI